MKQHLDKRVIVRLDIEILDDIDMFMKNFSNYRTRSMLIRDAILSYIDRKMPRHNILDRDGRIIAGSNDQGEEIVIKIDPDIKKYILSKRRGSQEDPAGYLKFTIEEFVNKKMVVMLEEETQKVSNILNQDHARNGVADKKGV